jgi:hypothetical protein
LKVTLGSDVTPKFINQIKEAKYFPILLDKKGGAIPAYVRISSPEEPGLLKLQLISLPNLAGMVTVNALGLVVACNSMFTKFLVGLPAKELIRNEWNITSLIPDFFKVVEKFHLLPQQVFQNGSGTAMIPVSVVSPKAQRVSMYHRDGLKISIDIQIRLLVDKTGMEDIKYACWITNNYVTDSQPPKPVHANHENPDILNLLESPVKGGLNQKNAPNEFPNITTRLSDYKVLEKLGEGAYGSVSLVVRKDDPQQENRVLKQIVKNRVLIESWIKDDILGMIPMEIKLLHLMALNPHPNIVKMGRFFEDRDFYYIEMGLHGFGLDLFDYIELHTKMSELEIKHIFYQVVCAVKHLHSQGIVHRDIKVILEQYPQSS